MSTDNEGNRTPAEKLRVVVEASQLSDEDLGAFLRKEGLHEATLHEWQEAATAGLSAPRKSGRGNNKSPEAKKVVALERELRRKEKAMAEMAAIITLQKKVRDLWGAADDDTTEGSGT